MLAVVALALALLFLYAFHIQGVVLNWSDLVNGLLRDTIGFVLGTVLTIFVYRWAYHRRKG